MSTSARLAPSETRAPYPPEVLGQLVADAAAVVARYPEQRSALLPLLHLVQSVDGYVSGRGIEFCAQTLGLTTAEVSGVATFYTQYKRHPNGEYTVGVCTNTLCAIMGGDAIWDSVSEHLGIGHDETTDDGSITLERVECNAACDYAPVVMVNWEFFDNQTPASTNALVDDLRAGAPVEPTRGARTVCTFRQMSRVLAGFPDGRADEGVGAGPASLVGLALARANGWSAPGDQGEVGDEHRSEGVGPAGGMAAGRTSSTDSPSNDPAQVPATTGPQQPAADDGRGRSTQSGGSIQGGSSIQSSSTQGGPTP